MSTVPVDIRVGVQKGSVLRKLEKQILRLEKTAADLIVGFNTRNATRQLGAVDKQLGFIQADAKNIALGFKLDQRGLRQAQGQIDGLSSSGGGGGGGFASSAAAEAVGGIAAAQAVGNQFSGSLAKANEASKGITMTLRQNAALIAEANEGAAKYADIQVRSAVQEERKAAAQAKVGIQTGQVKRLTNANNKSLAAGKKLTEGQVKALVDAKDLLKGTKAELTGSATSMRLLAEQGERFARAAKGFPKQGFSAPRGARGKSWIPEPAKRNRLRAAQTRASAAASTVGNAVGNSGLIGGVATAAGLTAIVKGAADLEQVQLKVKLLSKEFGEYEKIQDLIEQNAQTFNQSQFESATAFANVYARLRPLGIELEDIQKTYAGFNAVAITSGATAREASSAFLQLSQALGSGRLQGDEFRSISEQVPGILRLIADETGATVGELKELGREGLLTSDILIKSLAKGFDQNKDKIKAIIDLSPAAKFKTLSDEVSNLGNAMGTELLPAVTPVVKGLTTFVKMIGDLPGPVKTATGALIGLGGAAVIATAGIKALGLKVAVVAPYLAMAVAVGAIAVQVYKVIAAVEEAKRLNAQGTVAEIDAEIAKLKTQLDAANTKTVTWYNSLLDFVLGVDGASTAVDGLTGRIDELNKRRIQILDTDPTQGAGFDFNAILKGFGGRDYVPPVVKTPKPKGGSGRSGPAPRESQLPQLNQQITASEKLLALDRQILDAQFEENTALVQQLEAVKILTEYENELAAIALEKIPAAEKQAKGTIALTNAMGEQAALADQIRTDEKDRVTTLKELMTGFDREIELAGEKDRYAKALKQIEYDILDLRDQGILKTPEEIASYKERAEAAAALTDQMSGTKQMLSDAYDIVSGELTNSIKGLIDGTKEWGDVLSDIAGQLGKMFLNAGFNGLGGMLGFADGGRPPMGQVSVVGERGPELFVPDSPGQIVNSEQSKAAMASYGPNDAGVSAGPSGPININYEGPTLNFNQDEYLPVSAVPGLIKEAAAAGEKRTMNKMRYSPAARRRAGI